MYKLDKFWTHNGATAAHTGLEASAELPKRWAAAVVVASFVIVTEFLTMLPHTVTVVGVALHL